MKEEVYISYAWIKSPTGKKGHSTIINSIEKILKYDFSVKIDKKDLKYKGNIKEFEQRLGRNGKIVIVINDKFLKSKHCMHEVQCIVEKGNVYERIFPVVLDDADIYNSKGILKYAKYWEKERERLEKDLKKTKSQANLIPVQNDINLFSKYREIIADFIAILSNMNTLCPEVHEGSKFEQLIEALHGKNPRPDHKQEKDYTKRISATKKLFDSAIKIIEKEIKERKIKAEEISEK